MSDLRLKRNDKNSKRKELSDSQKAFAMEQKFEEAYELKADKKEDVDAVFEAIENDNLSRKVGVFASFISVVGFIAIIILLFMYVLFPNYKHFKGESERGFVVDSVMVPDEQVTKEEVK